MSRVRSALTVIGLSIATLAIVVPLGAALGARLVSPASAGGNPAAQSRPASNDTLAIPVVVVQENPALGYRISLPEGYRRSRSLVMPAGQEAVGHDAYVNRSVSKELELCLRAAQSDVQSSEREADFRIEVYRDLRGISAADWIRTMNLTIAHTSIESILVAGYEAARVVDGSSGDTAFFVIRANQHVYVLTQELRAQPSNLPKGWLDSIAASFRATTPQPSGPTVATPRCGT